MRNREKFDCLIFMASVRKMANAPVIPTPGARVFLGLLRLNGEDFVRGAYRAIFEREVDPAGMRVYLPSANSLYGKVHTLAKLLTSPERGAAPMWQMTFKRRLKILARGIARK